MSGETVEEFFNERRDFFELRTVYTPERKGYDVLLRIDGSYAMEQDALDVQKYWRNILNAILRNHPYPPKNNEEN